MNPNNFAVKEAVRQQHEAYEQLAKLVEKEKLEKVHPSGASSSTLQSEWPGAGKNSVMGPQCEQSQGMPFVFYQRVANSDLKFTGLRMSACLAAMDNCRTDMFTTCDMSVESFRKVNDLFIEVAIELNPAIRKLGGEVSRSGLLHKTSRGALGSWLRLEAVFGWPGFPIRSEETTLYHVGKDKSSSQREPLCTARFIEAFTDKDEERALNGDAWERDAEQYWANVKENHSVNRLAQKSLFSYYNSEDEPFSPTNFTKVCWLMTHSYGDLWELLYHGKTSELLWDVNKLAGGDFANLVAEDPDPQALAMNLPKPMEVGTQYDVMCYLDVQTSKAVYVLLPKGSTALGDVVLAVCARYKWQGVPQHGKTLCKEDLQVLSGPSRNALVNFALGLDFKATKAVDFEKVAWARTLAEGESAQTE